MTQTGWTLPEVVDPDRVCLKLEIPNDFFHLAAFWGAMLSLSYWFNWSRDDAQTGKAAADVWFDVFTKAQAAFIAGCPDCPMPILPRGMEVDFDMSGLRIDCDCNVWITCCDGTEKQIFTADQVRQAIDGQPGNGAPQPPNGGCQIYGGTITGLSKFLIPTIVNTGDTIEIQSANGASNDAVGARWNCPDGTYFFAGLCGGPTYLDPSSLVPAAPAGSLVIGIDGVWYALDGEFTVPGGVTNGQAVVALNYPQADQISGTVTLAVNVCNNAVGTYTHVFNFPVGTDGWVLNPDTGIGPRGVWTAGAGWTHTDTINDAGGWWRGVSIKRVLSPAANINSIEVVYNDTPGAFDGTDWALLLATTDTPGAWDTGEHASDLSGPQPYSFVWDNPITGLGYIQLVVNASSASTEGGLSGSATIKQVIIRGPGSDPF